MPAEIASTRAAGVAGEAQLLDLASAGDVDAFDMLLRPRLGRMFRMAVAIMRSESDARDAIQDASVNAWREVPRLRDRARFDAWLDQIVVNACRSMLRRQRRVRVREVDVGVLSQDDADTHRGPTFTTRDDIGGVSEVDVIRGAFERLDPDVRALLVLHYVEERPLAEIGRVLGSPVGTIKWRLSKARKALDRALEAERR